MFFLHRIMKILSSKRMYITFVILGIIGFIFSIISFGGLSYLGLLDADKITFAKAEIYVVSSTPNFKVQNWKKGGRKSGSGTLETPFVAFNDLKDILILPNGFFKDSCIQESVVETKATFSQIVFPKAVHIRQVKKCNLLQFPIGDNTGTDELNVLNGTVSLYLNDTKMVFNILPQKGIKIPNGFLISVSM